MVDTDKRKAENAAAPKVENLLGRIAELFTNHRKTANRHNYFGVTRCRSFCDPTPTIERTFNEGLFPSGGATKHDSAYSIGQLDGSHLYCCGGHRCLANLPNSQGW